MIDEIVNEKLPSWYCRARTVDPFALLVQLILHSEIVGLSGLETQETVVESDIFQVL